MTAAQYRRWIREALALASPHSLPEAALRDGVRTLAGGAFDESEFRRALEWNLAKDYVRSKTNEDTDLREWGLTGLGRAKQESE